MASQISPKDDKIIPVEIKNDEFTIRLKSPESQERGGFIGDKKSNTNSYIFYYRGIYISLVLVCISN
jgi:hypothetical protein